MKNYKNSSYAANKYSKDIVYYSEVSGSTAITLENFLRSDPTLTEADFEFWKKWSDQNYLEESRVNNKQSWKAVSLSNLDYILDSTQLSLEEMVEDKTMEGLVLQTLNQTVSVLLSDSVLTETMKVRFEELNTTVYFLKESENNGLKIAEGLLLDAYEQRVCA